MSAEGDTVTGAHLREAQKALIRKLRGEGIPMSWVNRNAIDLLARASFDYSEWLESHEAEENPVGWLVTCAYRHGLNQSSSQQGERLGSESIDADPDIAGESIPTPERDPLAEVGDSSSAATTGRARLALSLCGAAAVAVVCALVAGIAPSGPSAKRPYEPSRPSSKVQEAPPTSVAEQTGSESQRASHSPDRPRKSPIRRAKFAGASDHSERGREATEAVTVQHQSRNQEIETFGPEGDAGSPIPPPPSPPTGEPGSPAPPPRSAPPASGAAVEAEFGL
jgi:hypothetical protein